MRQMILTGFLQAQNCSVLASTWRHPEGRTDFMSAEYYQEIARVLEAGKFQLAFFDDRLAMPDMLGGDHAHTVAHGIRCVKLDPIVVLMTMAMATSRLGLGATYSTTYYEPFHVARLFQTLDHMSGGRAAWNIVTSVNDGEAMNMGREEHLPHDLRYDRADEFMAVVLGHWDGWEDGAILMDKAAGRFADPAKVHRLDHRGEFFRSRGPFTVPRSPQGHPVLIQAGASGRGRAFAARWGEVLFVAQDSIPAARQAYAEMKAATAALGRDPDKLSIGRLTYPVAAASRAEAEDKMAVIEAGYDEMDGLSLLSEAMNFDFAKRGLDEAFSDADIAAMTGIQAMRNRVLDAAGPNPTPRDFLRVTGRGRPHNALVGGPKEIADVLEEWFTSRACDGFVIAASAIPGTYQDFVTHVVPELQKRGLFHKEYEGATLRENLGLSRPEPGWWR